MQRFTKPEFLEQENRYRCEKCRQLVRARKQLTLHTPPRHLTVQLKRFTFGAGGMGGGYGGGSGKISSHVSFPLSWDLTQYSTEGQRLKARGGSPASAPRWLSSLFS